MFLEENFETEILIPKCVLKVMAFLENSKKITRAKIRFETSLTRNGHLLKLILITLKGRNKSTTFWYQNQTFYNYTFL